MSEPVSVLNGAAAEGGLIIAIADRGPVGQVTLRADLADPAVTDAVRDATGAEMPGTWQCRIDAAGHGAVWMSPDELLLLVPYAEAEAKAAQLSEALGERHHMAVNVSDARVVLALSGARVAEVLSKGVPVDLSDTAFPVGSARRSHLAETAVGFWRIGQEDWEIVCFRSFAQHLFDWLTASGVEGAEVDHL